MLVMHEPSDVYETTSQGWWWSAGCQRDTQTLHGLYAYAEAGGAEVHSAKQVH